MHNHMDMQCMFSLNDIANRYLLACLYECDTESWQVMGRNVKDNEREMKIERPSLKPSIL